MNLKVNPSIIYNKLRVFTIVNIVFYNIIIDISKIPKKYIKFNI